MKIKPRPKVILYKLAAAIIMLFSFCFLIWILLSTNVLVSLKLFLSIFTGLSLAYGIYYLAYPFFTYLILSSVGIVYSEPLFSVFCEWEQFKSVRFTKERLELIYPTNAKVKGFFLFTKYHSQDYIPIHIFVDQYTTSDNWQKNKTLLMIQEKIPEISEEIIKAMNSN